MSREIWVLAEHRAGELREVTKEMLSEARPIAQKLGRRVGSVLLGAGVAQLAAPLAHYGTEVVYLAEHELLAGYSTDAYVTVLFELVQQYEPSLLICGATPNGSDLAPRLAARMGIPLASGCLQLDLTGEGELIATIPGYEGKVYAKVLYPAARLQIATFLPGVRGYEQGDGSRRCDLVKVAVQLGGEQIRTRSLGVIPADPRTVDVSEARVVVAGGRGVGDAHRFQALWELADLLGAAVAGTRVAVDRGWLPVERLVGATGKRVKPKLYFACGLSGAMQHAIGMADSDAVIAINSDRTAPIFSLADLGVLADLDEVMPLLIRRLRQRSGQYGGRP